MNAESFGEAGLFSRLQHYVDVFQLTEESDAVQLTIAMPKSPPEAGAVLPRAALPEAGRVASGRGLTLRQAELSCLGEAAELASTCLWGDEALLTASFEEVGAAGLHPAGLLLASEEQYRRRSDWNAIYGGFDWMPESLETRKPIEWIEAVSPDGTDRTLVPAANVFIGHFENGDAGAFAVADSNGCAAGPTLEAATVKAFLEVVERDATALWWYGGHSRPIADLENMAEARALKFSIENGRRIHILDVTTDLEIPAFVAISSDPDGSAVAIGAAADFDAERAVISALTEMAQTEFSLEIRKAEPADKGDPFQFWLDNVTVQAFPHLAPVGIAQSEPAVSLMSIGPATAENCQRIARNSGLKMFVLDMTRPQIGVPVARVIVPCMRSTRCRLADGRLYEVPSRLGWCDQGKGMTPNIVPLAI